jgi:hypothetical protein
LVIATLFCAPSGNMGLAQSSGEEIMTDRPDITESAVVVPKASPWRLRSLANRGYLSAYRHCR